MNLTYLFQSWSYHTDVNVDAETLMRALCKQEYDIDPDDIVAAQLSAEQAIELRQTSMLIQAIVAKTPGRIKVYDPRWLQPVAKAQLPAEHLYFDTPAVIVLPGYLWWQALTYQPVEWLCGQRPNVDF